MEEKDLNYIKVGTCFNLTGTVCLNLTQMINAGERLIVNNRSFGYLSNRIVFYLLNLHIKSRRTYFVRVSCSSVHYVQTTSRLIIVVGWRVTGGRLVQSRCISIRAGGRVRQKNDRMSVGPPRVREAGDDRARRSGLRTPASESLDIHKTSDSGDSKVSLRQRVQSSTTVSVESTPSWSLRTDVRKTDSS